MAANLVQQSFRGRWDTGGEPAPPVGAPWKAGTNQQWSQQVDESFRVRIRINNTGEDPSSLVQFRLQWRRNGGAWVNVNTVTESYVGVRSENSAFITSGNNCSQQLGSDNFLVNNHGLEDIDAVTDFAVEVPAGPPPGFIAGTECEYALELVGVDLADGDLIEFRIVRSTGAELESYVIFANLIVNHPGTFLSMAATMTDQDSLSTAELEAVAEFSATLLDLDIGNLNLETAVALEAVQIVDEDFLVSANLATSVIELHATLTDQDVLDPDNINLEASVEFTQTILIDRDVFPTEGNQNRLESLVGLQAVLIDQDTLPHVSLSSSAEGGLSGYDGYLTMGYHGLVSPTIHGGPNG